MTKKLGDNGFGLLGSLLMVVIIAALGAGGWLAWHAKHPTKKPSGTTTSSTQKKSNNSSSGSTTTTQADPYAGWKTYCDTTYHYCFKYPSTWSFAVVTAPEQPCDAGQVEITSADGTVDLSYQNDNNHDGALPEITPTSIEALGSAKQSLTILGSYFSGGTNYLPSYAVVDSSLLTTYPLTVGVGAQFPEQAEFTDQGSGAMSCNGSFTATSSQPINTLAGAKTWFTTSDAQTSLQILKSFSYEQ